MLYQFQCIKHINKKKMSEFAEFQDRMVHVEI